MNAIPKTVFVPMLIIKKGTMDIGFYNKAFGAIELRRWSNEDGSVHVAEFSIDGAMFHLHEEAPESGSCSPETNRAVTTTIGLMVTDVDAIIARALAAGAKLASPAQDYDYGYRQGEVLDPFGHHWLIEKTI
ncbi:MAG TPA: VOC family protein [Puia sp.]|nr:VOC family protein [Puia sp.]